MQNQKTESPKNQTPISIEQNVPLADKNWFKTGGAAQFYCEPQTGQDFQQAVAFLKHNNLDAFLLGQGANILISDNGFDGLVIKPQLKTIEHAPFDTEYELITVGAGVDLHYFIDYCLKHNIGGLEEFSGIPGSIGGAVYINLHYFEFLLEQFLQSAQVIEKKTGALLTVDPTWFNFGYNQSKLLEKKHYLVSATFKLKKLTDLESAYAQGRRIEIIRHRARRYPQSGTCGSFFRNFLPHEVEQEKSGKKLIFVAYYLDKLGVKGALRVGDAQVSHQHANMIVNTANATSHDIIELARTMQILVHNEFGILPVAECQFVGFKEYPLIQ